MSKKKVNLLIIDPQRGFCDPTLNGGKGELFVPGSVESVKRLAEFVRKKGKYLNDIDVTLDSHHLLHIGHPLYWRNSKGEQPPPFTPVGPADVEAGTWTPRVPTLRAYTLGYLKQLESRGRYKHTVWPPHCIIGTPGHSVVPELMDALLEWEEKTVSFVGKHSKGSCIYTEHFSGVQAEVPHPEDPSTGINVGLVKTLQECDTLVVAGWAASHCVANTIRDVAQAFGDPSQVKKMILLSDCTDSVPGCEAMTAAFLDEYTKLGMSVQKSTDVL